MTGREAVTASLRLIGAIAPGESVAASEATDGLDAMNRMLGGWSTEGLLINAETKNELTLVPGTASYTMGTGGTFNTSRPQQILQAILRKASGGSNIDHPVRILTLSEWAEITQKGQSGQIPRSLYADGGYPLNTITLYPVPSEANTLIVYSLKPLSEISTLDTSISMPPGTDRAIIYNLAVELAPEYGRAVPDAVAMIAQDSKEGLKRMNQRPAYLTMDDAILGVGKTTYDIYTGGS